MLPVFAQTASGCTGPPTPICLTLGYMHKAPQHLTLFCFSLSILKEYQKLFPDIPIGYSGHETGIAVSVAAVALGAKVLERHITLDKTWKGSDHAASLEPGELAELVRSVRLVERAMGSPIKRLLPCEMACNEKVGSARPCWAPLSQRASMGFPARESQGLPCVCPGRWDEEGGALAPSESLWAHISIGRNVC